MERNNVVLGAIAASLVAFSASAQTIPNLPAASSVNSTDLMAISQSNTTKKATTAQIITGAAGTPGTSQVLMGHSSGGTPQWTDVGQFNVKAYGALGNTKSLVGVTVTLPATANPTLTVTGASFTSADVGKAISVTGAGSGGAEFVTTIKTYTSATQVVLNGTSSTGLSSSTQTVNYGTDDTTAVQAAFTAAQNAATSGIVFFPHGLYFLNSQITGTFSDNRYASIGAVGEGPEASILYWPASSGMAITLNYPNQSFRVRELTFVTGTNSALSPNYTGLSISGYDTSPSTQSDISDVTFRGLIGTTHYWQTDVSVFGTSLILFSNDWFVAPNDVSNKYSVVISNGSGSNESVYNFIGSNWSGGGIGVYIGSYVQGVSFDTVSFGGLYTAIQVASSSAGNIGGLLVTNSSFVTDDNTIVANTAFHSVGFTNNFFVLAANKIGIYLPQGSYQTTIVGNQFGYFAGGASGRGVDIESTNYLGTIVGNAFYNMGTPYYLTSGTSGIVAADNSFYGSGNTGINLSSNNTVLDGIGTAWTSYTPTASCGSGSATWGTITGYYKTVGKTTYISINAAMTSAGTCATNVNFTLPNTAASVAVLSGRENNNTGSMLQANISSGGTGMQVQRYDNVAVIANGDIYQISGVYQNQ